MKSSSFCFLLKNVPISKDNKIYGIDIRKDKLDVCREKEAHFVVENSSKGFQELKKKKDKKALVVIEAMGYVNLSST